MTAQTKTNVTLIGAGTIGLSLAALHIQRISSEAILRLTIHDTRPDIEDHAMKTLRDVTPRVFNPGVDSHGKQGYTINLFGAQGAVSKQWLFFDNSLESAVAQADIVEEQGPENEEFKKALWPQVEQFCPKDALLWSSTSGIPASVQSKGMKDPSRLLIVHPYNPPHIMPLLELVPSPVTNPEVVSRTIAFWEARDRTPIVVRKEVVGFVANRLAFALLREAIHLVNEGVASVADVDNVVQTSMGPRWAVAGPFKSYAAGGGQDGLEGFFRNIGQTVQDCWNDSGNVNMGDGWETEVFKQTKEAYGVVNTRERDRQTVNVLNAIDEDKGLYDDLSLEEDDVEMSSDPEDVQAR